MSKQTKPAGYAYEKKSGKWVAYICVNKNRIWLGRYDTEEEAISARREAEQKYAQERIKHAKTTEKICLVCGRAFVATHHSAKYCSDDCAKVNQKQKKKTKPHKTPEPRACVVCGRDFVPASARQKRCDECSEKNLCNSVCANCGKHIVVPNSTNKHRFCSRECFAEWQRKRHTGQYLVHKKEMPDDRRAKLGELLRSQHDKAIEAWKNSPLGGDFETFISAKSWEIISPTGKTYSVRNLRKFIREHSELFPDGTPRQISSGFSRIARSMRDNPDGNYSCWGWKLKKPPVVPDDTREILERARKKREIKEAKKAALKGSEKNE